MRLLLSICLFASTAFAQFDNVAFVGSLTNATAPAGAPTPDLLWITFDGSGTSLTDHSTAGTRTHTLSSTSARVTGSPANAMQGDGSSYYAYSASNLSLGTNKITICVWLKLAGTGAYVASELSENYNGASDPAWIMLPNLADKASCNIADSGEYNGWSVTETASGTWLHISFLCDATPGSMDTTVYTNKVLAGATHTYTDTGNGGNFLFAPHYLGARGGTSLFMPTDAQISDFRIYSGLLSSANIQKIYDAALHP